ncbi:glycoside hydrolase family 35 protein [Cristinia sonorae]|uniref:Beta-galactosidase n=1 Tax=Cristinia sonorae TaxID=1940300 RepID=A0A8K0UIK1_9AGAR|nr:glycoside hydrolase family 35 protein [Cristinia sonorae]
MRLLNFVLAAVLFSTAKSISVPSELAADTYSQTLARRNSTGLTDAVTWDSYSLSIHGQRTFILSAEVHPWRMPNPELWADILQKVRANGFNTVSIYVNWALHYPTPDTNRGKGDWQEGTYRDIQRFIDEVQKAGLWLIARPGPYINGETTGGGFPGWVGNVNGSVRTDNPAYKETWVPYMTEITKIIARNQITRGGPIIMVQAENEFSAGGSRSGYMQDIIDLYHELGIVVPTMHNDQHAGRAEGNYSPDLPGTGRVNIYCADSYPQGQSSWSQPQTTYYSNHKAVAPSNPHCLAEFGGGYLLGWGSVGFGGTGYEKYSNDLSSATYENIFYKDAYSQSATIFNVYMLYGGTNWGQTLEPTVYSSYDYGGGINENRIATPKMNEMRLQGLFLRVATDLLAADRIGNGTQYTSSASAYTTELRNKATNGAFYFLRQNDARSLDKITTTLTVSTSAGTISIPRSGTITLNGRDTKIIVTDFVFGASKTNILYSTTEVMTWTTIDDTDYIVLYALSGETGETVLTFPTKQKANLEAAAGVSATVSESSVTLNYDLGAPSFTRISVGGKNVVVITVQKETAYNWHAVDIPGRGDYANYFGFGTKQSVLVSGPYLIRSGEIHGSTLALTGDLSADTDIEVVVPSSVRSVTWNGKQTRLTKTSQGTYKASLKTVAPVQLPDLSSLKWKVSGSLPEIAVDFDDSSFVTADQKTTNYTNLPPLAGEHVLYSQQYGFFGGNLIWRGHFNASGQETAFNLTLQGGLVFGYSAFLNGVFLGSGQGTTTSSIASNVWEIPQGSLRVGKDNVLTILQDHMGIVETSSSSGKEPRGIRGYSIIGGNTTFSYWKLQGNQGGAAKAPDTVRGYLNEGGLYAERIGAHLPGYPDNKWQTQSPLSGVKGAGVNFYRTTFNPRLPHDVDVPVRLSITPSDPSSNFRVQIYINGWQFGKYINNVGPQTIYVLPAGILRPRSTNTLALSVWSLDGSGATIAGLSLISDGTYSSALDIKDYTLPPDYNAAQKRSRPAGKVLSPM